MIDVRIGPQAAVKTAPAHTPRAEAFPALPESGWAMSRTLRPSPLTPAVARRLARESCRERGICRIVADKVEMVVGEMVSLSVRQARSPVTLTIVIDRGDVVIDVLDGGQRPPAEGRGARGPRQVDAIERLAGSWGFDRLEGGRRLWAVVTAQDARHRGPTNTSALIPRPESEHRPERPNEYRSSSVDPTLARRLASP
jgi:hypothetical protein